MQSFAEQPTLMIKNYLKIAWRNLLRHKSFSFINILGLSIGIAACMIIFLFVQYELTYDRYNTNYDNIARVTTRLHAPNTDYKFATAPIPLADALVREYPEVKAAARIVDRRTVVRSHNELFSESYFYSADQHVFAVFTFTFLQGIAQGALQRPGTAVLTEKMALKYFGTNDVTGKTLICNDKPYTITAVIANRPANSDIHIDGMLYEDFTKATGWMDDFNAFTFVLFHQKPTSLEAFVKKIQPLSTKYIQPGLDAEGAKDYHVYFEAEQLADVHFSQEKQVDTPKGNRLFNYIFSLLAVFILVIALLNYINLSTARATERAKEVGIRKVNGARPWQLIRQFMFESFFLVSIAWIIALALVASTLPLFNNMLQTALHFDWQAWLLFTIPAFVVTLLLAGIYPAFVLSSFNPVEILKGKRRTSSQGIFLRKSLTVAQFVITAFLITGSVVIYSQLKYIQHKDLGFVKEEVLSIQLSYDTASKGKVEALQQALKQMPVVRQISAGSGMQSTGLPMSSTINESNGKKKDLMCNYYFIDPAFIPLMNIPLVAGRNIADSFKTDKAEAFIVNEALVQKMGWQDPIGQPLEGFYHKGKVVGVVKNFYYKSLHNMVEPLVMVQNDQVYNIMLKIKPADVPAVKSKWAAFFPNEPFIYSFLDESVAEGYKKDKTTMQLFTCFTGLAIFISCLGLYGLIALMAIQRNKEISIRKVLGASLDQLLLLLTKDSVKLILLASVIGLPLALYGAHFWLGTYAYHINISWWMFVLPLLINIIIALLVIGRQVINAARANPVKSLKMD